ncbi:MAG: retroviral-like aspartic protease family protein [Nitrososphaeraceae archaeon]|nr:retroviral-like aspartic protease family protein [Nitrososphaeraceae archaeon]
MDTVIACDVCTFSNKLGVLNCEMCGNLVKPKQKIINSDVVGSVLKSLQTKNNIEKNRADAYNVIPESFFPVDMLHFRCSINGNYVEAFVDTGAQMSIMSESCAKICELNELIDYRYQGTARGVGQQTILGKIWLVDIDIGGVFIPCSFTILKDMDIDMIFGLDMLNSHRANINLKDKRIEIGDVMIPIIKKSKKEDK